MQKLKQKYGMTKFKKSIFWMLFSLFLLFAVWQFLPFDGWIQGALAIKCSDVVEDGKTAKELGLPCGEGLVAPKKELIDPTISNETDLRTQVLKIVNYFLSFLGLLAVIGMVYNGFLMVTSAFDEGQYEKGKKGIGYIAMGIVVILLSYVIVNWLIGAGGETSETWGTGENITVPDGGESTGTTENNNYYIHDDLNNSDANVEEIQNSLDELENNLSEYNVDLKDVLDLYNQYIKDPTKENWKKASAAYQDLIKEVLAMPMIKAVITVKPSSGNAPLQVTLDGLKSTDPNNATIPDGNYFWSYIDANGREVTLDKKSVVTTEFAEPGSYIINLKTVSDKIGAPSKKTVLDGHAYFKLTVYPESTKFNLKINGDSVQTFYKVDLESAKKGLSFDLSGAEPPIGHKFVRYLWNFGDGQVDERFDWTPFTHMYWENREYTAKVAILDDFKQEYTKRFKILVSSIVAKPIILPEKWDIFTEFSFDATQSKPSADKIVEYLWKVVDNSGKTVIESGEKVFTYNFSNPGEYTVELSVTNSFGETDTVTQKLKVDSRKPIANFTWKIVDPAKPNIVTFDAFESYDPDGEAITFDWDFDGDGKYDVVGLKEQKTLYTFKEANKYKTKLRVVDEFENFAEIEKPVEIESTLNVDFTVSKSAVSIWEEVDFVANASSATAYYWDFGDGVVFQSDEKKITHSFDRAGIFSVTLKVFNQENKSNSKTMKIYVGNSDTPIAVIDYKVNNENYEPVEDLCGQGVSGIEIYRTSKIEFDASKSVNSAGTSSDLEYLWDFGDGIYGSQKNANHYYTELSTDKCIAVSLLVKDKKLNVSAKSETLYLKVVNRLPSLSFLEIVPKWPLLTPVVFSLNARSVVDYDGKVIKYKWWYYREGDETPRGVQTTSEPLTEITVAGEGLTGQKNNYYFVVEMTDDNNGVINSSELFNNDVAFEIETGKNISPIVDFSADKTLIYVGDSISYSANVKNPQGGAVPKNAYKWDFDGDGNFDDLVSGSQVSRRYNIPWEYEVRLKVELNGLSTSKVKKIYVERLNDFPQAAFTFQVEGKTVSFDASNSRFDDSLEEQQLWYFWDFDTKKDEDGNGILNDDDQDNRVAPTYTYAQDWFYTVRLTVKDKASTTDIVERIVQVGAMGGVTSSNLQKESLKITSSNLMSGLFLSMPNITVSKGDTIDIRAQVVQANGEVYDDVVNYKIIEGAGDFLPEKVIAKNGIAISTFKANTTGLVIVEVTAPLVLGGPLVEHLSFNVE